MIKAKERRVHTDASRETRTRTKRSTNFNLHTRPLLENYLEKDTGLLWTI